jgi:hypothetical protein
MQRAWVSGLLLVMSLVSGPVRAATPSSAATWVQSSLLSASTIQTRLLACLARGDIVGAIAMYEAETGHEAPLWLRNLEVAYGVASQTAGKCQQVARFIHTAFIKLGQKPEYVAIRALEKREYMVFDMPNGKSPGITRNGYHVIVKVEDMVYDAYTGPLGMKLADYLSRVHAEMGFAWTVVSEP